MSIDLSPESERLRHELADRLDARPVRSATNSTSGRRACGSSSGQYSTAEPARAAETGARFKRDPAVFEPNRAGVRLSSVRPVTSKPPTQVAGRPL
jgi:hypothetical protein